MSNISTVISDLIATVKADEAKVIQAPLAAFFQSISTNPSALNIAAQVALFNAQFVAAQSGVEQSILAQLASVVSTQVAAAAASANGAVAQAAAGPAAA